MINYVNQVLDFPDKVNGMLPRNNWNEVISSSEDSAKAWLGFVYKVVAFAVLISMLYGVVTGGIDALSGEGSALSKIGSAVATLIYIYAAFPLAQIIRNAGDELTASKSDTVGFVFKDLVITNIKAVGYFAAMSAFFTAVVGVVSYVVNADVFTYSHSLNLAAGVADLPMTVLGTFAGMVGLDSIAELFTGLYGMEIMSDTYAGAGWTIEGLVGAGMAFVGVIIMLIQLYVSLAVYSFFYGLADKFVSWVKAPFIPLSGLK